MADHLLNLLNGMGSSPDEIAFFLEGQGCRGRLRDAEQCPVSVYLRRMTGIEYVLTGVQYIAIGEYLEDGRQEVGFDKVEAIRKFRNNFDEGKYPQLEVV